MPNDPPAGPGTGSRDRPQTEESYGIPADRSGLPTWAFVAETLSGERSFRVTTIRPERLLARSDYPTDSTRCRFDG